MFRAKILIVDDEKKFAQLLADFLQASKDKSYQFQVELAYNVDQAIDKIDHFLPDLIVTDLRMSKGREGLEIIKYLNDNNIGIPTIIITAFGNKENLKACLQKRPFDFIEKPANFLLVEKRIKQILTEVKRQSRAKPHYATVKSSIKKLPSIQRYRLVAEALEDFTPEEFEDFRDELPLIELSIKDEQQEREELDQVDREREAQGLIPLSLIEKGNIYYEKQSYKSKTTGHRSVYAYFYLRWMGDDGKQDFKYLGRYEKIKDSLILEKIHQQYPEFKHSNK